VGIGKHLGLRAHSLSNGLLSFVMDNLRRHSQCDSFSKGRRSTVRCVHHLHCDPQNLKMRAGADAFFISALGTLIEAQQGTPDNVRSANRHEMEGFA